jgi:omega-hydroxy-beta-dihydromenaquinone-9 sulfotransferase
MGPIAIVGCGRSGTTLLYRMLCCHADLAWFSNVTDRWPSFPALAALSNAYPITASRGIETSLVPIPSEGYPFWNELTRIDALPRDEPLTEHDVSSRAKALAKKRMGAIMRFQRKPRFLNKATRNVRRLRYVEALLDDVVFVHVLRDPRATVASLLRVAFWPDIPVWCEDNVTPRTWVRMGKDETTLAARLWASDVERARADAAAIDPDRLIEVRYEDLAQDPWNVVSGVARWARLPMNPPFARACNAFQITDRNRSIQTDLTRAQLDTITEVVGPVAERLGYTW